MDKCHSPEAPSGVTTTQSESQLESTGLQPTRHPRLIVDLSTIDNRSRRQSVQAQDESFEIFDDDSEEEEEEDEGEGEEEDDDDEGEEEEESQGEEDGEEDEEEGEEDDQQRQNVPLRNITNVSSIRNITLMTSHKSSKDNTINSNSTNSNASVNGDPWKQVVIDDSGKKWTKCLYCLNTYTK